MALGPMSRCKTPFPPQVGAAGVGDGLAGGEEEEVGAASTPAQHRHLEGCACGEE